MAPIPAPSALRGDPRGQKWVIFHLQDRLFAVDAHDVLAMIEIPAIARIPQAPAHVRGAFDFRGTVISVVDGRRRLGMTALADEMATMLSAREEDHRRWLETLARSLADGTEFKLATDPHKCAFGKWYDGYKPSNLVVGGLLSKFEAPHAAIHALAKHAFALRDAGDHDAARAAVEAAKENELAEMMRLFAELKRVIGLALHEIAIVLDAGEEQQPFAVVVDAVAAVDEVAEMPAADNDHALEAVCNDGLATSVRTYGTDNRMVLTLDTLRLVA
jgi:purine-binding chemotaxis protein CheW